MRKKLLSTVLCVAMAVSLLVGCSSGNSDSDNKSDTSSNTNSDSAEESTAKEDTAALGEKLKIGVSLNSNIEFVVDLQATMEEKAKELGNIELIFTNADNDSEKQLSDVESLIAQKPDVIIIRVVERDAGLTSLEAIKNAGIPIVLQDTSVSEEIFDVFVVGDQAIHGQLIGSYMQEWLDEDESRHINMGYINGSTSEAIQARETGIYDVVDAERITTLVTAVATGFSAEDAMSTAEDWLLAYPDMNCIACANDEMAIAVIQALNAAGKNLDDFLVFGVDASEIGREYIRNGDLKATTFQDSEITVDVLFDVCQRLVDGETLDSKIDPDNISLIKIDNIDEVFPKE